MASPQPMVGRTVGHYRVLEQIGAGGMGVVFRARDERLEREVALKVLPPGVLADEGARHRFRKEALALSRLNHPNIATVFDFDTQEGIDFLVTELIPGMTLDERLAAGSLPEKEIIQIGLQLTDGLQAAHQQGVIHRDLKPGNLRLTPEGRLKILDFGLAKRMDLADQASVTQSGFEPSGPAGTLAYMAPEQLKSEKVDVRSDLWGVGVVLYELAAGRRPFDGKTVTALAGEILHGPAPPLQKAQPGLSPRLAAIILKCLEKDRENRYQSAKELLVDLRRLASPATAVMVAAPARRAGRYRRSALQAAGFAVVLLVTLLAVNPGHWRDRLLGHPAPTRIDSLAVLPLENLSGDKEQEYFADGMTDELITNLADISALRVISRTSVMQYKRARKPLPEIARELHVEAVVEGSVLRSGDRVRITAQLIYAPTDKHLWAQSYERDLHDVLALQKEIARAIADQIRVALTPREQRRLASTVAINPDAYLAYQRGRFYWNQRNEAALRKAIESFQKAIAIEPAYAAAYSGIADCYTALGYASFLSPRESFPKAQAAAGKALELDPALADPHASLGYFRLYYDWNFAEAEREFRQAIALNPNYLNAHHWFSVYLTAMGRWEEAHAEIQKAQQLDPLSIPINTDMGFELYYSGHYDEAIQQLKSTLELNPKFLLAHLWLGRAFQGKGMYDQAISEYLEADRISPGWPVTLAALGNVYGIVGRDAEAQKILQEMQALAKQKFVTSYGVALVYAGLGRNDEAFAWLNRAFEERSHWLVWLKLDPRWGNVRSDPRFQDLLRRMNFPS